MRKVYCTREICKLEGSDTDMDVDQDGRGIFESGDNYAVTMSSSPRSNKQKRKRRVDQVGKGRRKRKTPIIRKKVLKRKTTKKRVAKKQVRKRRKGKKKDE